MSDIGDLIKSTEYAFDALQDEITVQNYTEGGEDEWRDEPKVEHPDSPQTVSGTHHRRGTTDVEGESYGTTAEFDRIFLIDDSAFVTSDNETWNGTSVDYPTRLTDPHGVTFTVVSTSNQGNGVIRCLARRVD